MVSMKSVPLDSQKGKQKYQTLVAYNKIIPFYFQIKASELYDDTRIGEARVNIKLRDVNDESPIFESQDFFFRVDEHAEPGSYLGTVKAKDLDIFDVIQ